ncbi:MAG: hypothetical protein SFX72_16300 [Isosphaeraceae bacterium]|nr:hypothetical protein [Isosphaeraceae bacterium]
MSHLDSIPPVRSVDHAVEASARHPRRGRMIPSLRTTAAAAFFLFVASPLLETASIAADLDALRGPEISRRWTIVRRTQTQDQGDWQVDYELRVESGVPVRLDPADFGISIRGAVSNSRVASHAFPRAAAHELDHRTGANRLSDVITAGSDLTRCRERIVARFWSGDSCEPPMPIAPHPALGPPAAPMVEPFGGLTILPGERLKLRIRLEHDHFLHGAYDPLLGRREVQIRLASDRLVDLVPLDREQYLAQGREVWNNPPPDRRDTRRYVSEPDSLYLEAHVPGNQSFRFAEIPVRYGTKMRLTFWYLTAPGTEGDFRMQVTQYKDSPNGWQILHAGMIERSFSVRGRWTKVEHVFKSEPQATSIALTYRIVGPTDVGEVWIDEISLTPVGVACDRP